MEQLKITFFSLWTLVSVVCLSACSDSFRDESDINQPDESSEEFLAADMLRINTSGSSVRLGTNDEMARSSERPQMTVTLDYAYYLGVHEVTCGEFNALMENVTGLQVACGSDSLPAAGVTYYDAVLFANARSSAEKKDTVYTYTERILGEGGNCTSLEGFDVRTDVDGYRLPTESEWMFAAAKDWDPSGGWNASNSDFRAHEVCTSPGTNKKEGAVFCDMAGNVMEWVGDWLGRFRDTTLSNYAGAPDGGTLGERVVKGGSYRNEPSAIFRHSRGDVYTVTSATKADYVGFRLAFGRIPSATWMSSDGSASNSRIVPLASSATVKSFTGTYRTKLAFRNDETGNLAFVDYSGGVLSVTEIRDTIDSYHPEISPDGKKVAFCTGLEGVSGKSSLYVRDLDSKGGHLARLEVESAAIPRWRVLENGDTVIVYVTDAGNNKDDAAFLKSSTWQVAFMNGQFGSPKKLLDGAYHGGIVHDGFTALTGARLLRAHVGGKDEVWYGSEQACNASLSNDSTKRTLFLDFGGKTGRAFAGIDYGTHRMLLIADSTGKLVQAIPSPDDYSFDHSEWAVGNSARNDLAVVSLSNADGAHKKIAFIDLTDSTITELVEGEELWHPSLWIQDVSHSNSDDILLNPDSAGNYLLSGGQWFMECNKVKMELFWQYKDSLDIVLLGSSRVEDGLNPLILSSGFALNMGCSMNDFSQIINLAENYAMNHIKKLKTIVIALDFDLWSIYDDYGELLYSSAPGYKYDADHNYWKGNTPENMLSYVQAAFPASEMAYASYLPQMGFVANGSLQWGEPLIEMDSLWGANYTEKFQKHFEQIVKLIDDAAEKNITVVGVVFPQNPAYANTGSFGRYGPQRSVVEKLMECLRTLEKENSNFFVLDENQMGNHDYKDEHALNTDHLSNEGAQQLSLRLDSLLKKIK